MICLTVRQTLTCGTLEACHALGPISGRESLAIHPQCGGLYSGHPELVPTTSLRSGCSAVTKHWVSTSGFVCVSSIMKERLVSAWQCSSAEKNRVLLC